MPSLAIITDQDQLTQRALPKLPTLPSLPSDTSLSIEEKKNTLTRATTWVGNSIQRWLSTADAEERRKMAILSNHSELDEEEEQSILYSSSLITSTLSQRMTLNCRSYQYTMHMRATNNTVQTHTGMLKRIAKGISAAHPRVAHSFDVQGRFQLECTLTIKPCSSTNFVSRIRSLASKTNLASEEYCDNDDEEDEEICLRGRLVLDSGVEPLSGFANKGIGRYSIQTSNHLALELTAAFWLEENNDYIEEDDIYTPIDQEVLNYCQAGDYLTIYVKGDSYPVRNIFTEKKKKKKKKIEKLKRKCFFFITEMGSILGSL
ncbi:hypothetical protein BD770DRAFT_453525 [Pilaira anomala]|nr:hypothetical protein BD770DRAFT_453525 [Pilaira anomala]